LKEYNETKKEVNLLLDEISKLHEKRAEILQLKFTDYRNISTLQDY